MGKGRCFVIVYSIILCALFAIFVYLMTIVNPPPRKEKNRIDTIDDVENKDDVNGKVMLVKSKRIDKLLEDLLLLRSNGSIYGVPWPIYPTMLDDSTLGDKTTPAYQTHSNQNTRRISNIEDFEPRRVFPPLVPYIEMLLNDTDETTKPENITPTLKVSTVPIDTTSIKSHKRSADWYKDLDSDENDKDSDSLFIKILDEVGQARVEIKLGPHLYDKSDVLINENNDNNRKKSYNMLIRRNKNEQMMKAKNITIKIKQKERMKDSYTIEEQPSKPPEIYSIDLNPTELIDANDTNHEKEFHNTDDEILDTIEAKNFHKILYHWIANSSLNKAFNVDHLDTNESILAPENKEDVRTSPRMPDEGNTYPEKIPKGDSFRRTLEPDNGSKNTTTEKQTMPWHWEMTNTTTTSTEQTTTLSEKVREALRNMIDI